MRPADLACSGSAGTGLLTQTYEPISPGGSTLIDLRRTSWIDPIGFVAISVHIETQAALGRAPKVIAPLDGQVANYASRMRLGEMVETFGGDHNLPVVRHRDRAGELLELQSFSSEREVEDLAALIYDKVAPQDDEVAKSLHQSVLELGTNVPNHALRDCGYAAAQATHSGRVVRFAIGDAGIGLTASLRGIARDDQHALELVMAGGVSRTGVRGRGLGISSTRECLLRVGGLLTAESGTAATREVLGHGSSSYLRASSIPGVLMQGLIDQR